MSTGTKAYRSWETFKPLDPEVTLAGFGPMFAHFRLKRLSCADTDEGKAQPYMWAVYAKIDDTAAYYALNQDAIIRKAFGGLTEAAQGYKKLFGKLYPAVPKRSDWLHAPGGPHGNIGGPVKAKGWLDIPTRYGYHHFTLNRLVTGDSVAVGCLAMFLEQDMEYYGEEVAKAYEEDLVKPLEESLVVEMLRLFGMETSGAYDEANPGGCPAYRTNHPEDADNPLPEGCLEETVTRQTLDAIKGRVSIKEPEENKQLLNWEEFIGVKAVIRYGGELAAGAGQNFEARFNKHTGDYTLTGTVAGWASPVSVSVEGDAAEPTVSTAVGVPSVYSAGGFQHAFYRGSDDHVHELWYGHNAWRHNDLTLAVQQKTGFQIFADSPPSSVFRTSDKSQRVNFRKKKLAAEGKSPIDEFAFTIFWNENSVEATAEATAQQPTTFDSPVNRVHWVLYVSPDQHVHALRCNAEQTWTDVDLTPGYKYSPSKGAKTSRPAGFAVPHKIGVHVFFRDNAGHLKWVVSSDGARWQEPVDLLKSIGAPVITYDPHAFTQLTDRGAVGHVVYRSVGVQLLTTADFKTWQQSTPSKLAGAPPPAGSPFGLVWGHDNSVHLFYRGTDNHIYELANNGGWKFYDLTKAAGAKVLALTDPVGYSDETDRGMHVVYVGTDHHLHDLVLTPTLVPTQTLMPTPTTQKWKGTDLFKAVVP